MSENKNSPEKRGRILLFSRLRTMKRSSWELQCLINSVHSHGYILSIRPESLDICCESHDPGCADGVTLEHCHACIFHLFVCMNFVWTWSIIFTHWHHCYSQITTVLLEKIKWCISTNHWNLMSHTENISWTRESECIWKLSNRTQSSPLKEEMFFCFSHWTCLYISACWRTNKRPLSGHSNKVMLLFIAQRTCCVPWCHPLCEHRIFFTFSFFIVLLHIDPRLI